MEQPGHRAHKQRESGLHSCGPEWGGKKGKSRHHYWQRGHVTTGHVTAVSPDWSCHY